MSTDTFQSVFDGIFQEAFDLLVERQRKYGPKNIESLGLFGTFGRLSDDKVERIRRSLNGKVEHGRIILDEVEDFADESFEDALFDIANYALIMIALKRGLWGRPLDEDIPVDTSKADAFVEELTKMAPVALTFEPIPQDCLDYQGRCCARTNATAHPGEECGWCVFHDPEWQYELKRREAKPMTDAQLKAAGFPDTTVLCGDCGEEYPYTHECKH